MDQRNQDATRESEARRHSISSRAREGFSDHVHRVFSVLRTNYLASSGWRPYLLLICLSCMLLPATSRDCAIGLRTPGWTEPQGDIVIKYGNSLKIYCILNQTYMDIHHPDKNSSDLVFFRNSKEIGSEYITIVNSTAIYLTLRRPPLSESMFYCQMRTGDADQRHVAVCLNKVVIGLPPQRPKNFTCISENWQNMICSWQPVKNHVYTRFTLMFRLSGRTGGRKLFPCPKDFPRSLPPNTCMWSEATDPIYRQPYDRYTFVLYAENVLGNASYTFKVNHYANVIPAKPQNLTVLNKTLDSAMLYWTIPFPLETFPPGVYHRIMYENQWDGQNTWKVINITTKSHKHKKYYNLTGLEYANTVYDVRVLLKSAVASEDKWGDFSHVTFRTPPRLPGRPPRTDVGSFEIAENNVNRDIYLYWQAIPAYLENGDSFKYQIIRVEENGRAVDQQALKPCEMTRSYVKFKGISFNDYRFEIASMNEIGLNEERARIFVPSKYEMPHEPLTVTKIAFEGGLYELSWKPPVRQNDITNYTIFWCDNDRDRPYQCTGYLDWVHVPKNTTVYNMTVSDPDKVYQFAISANSARGSSGMIWASCTVIHNKVVGKMKSVWINRIGSNFIEVGWKLDCSDRIGIIEGFNIYYCPLLSPYSVDCKGPKFNRTIKAEPHLIHGIIDNLKPYTTYMMTITVLTKSGEGLHSDPLYNTTLEAAPSTPPLDVKITNVTNTTMFITWKPPTAMNGVLRYYEVHYNGQARKVEEKTYVELKNLSAYRRYNVSVVACTVECSKQSPVESRYTSIGTPGRINVPTVRFMNSSQVVVTWNVPREPAAPLENIYYEIETNNGEIQNTTLLSMQLPIIDCKIVSHERQYTFRVRAINVVKHDVHLIGPWSDPGEGNCYSDGPSLTIWIFIWVVSILSSLAFLSFLAYMGKIALLKWKSMRDVEVKLPPGLAPNMKLLQKVNDQHIRQSSAESSGCSSGQESVTSSLTAESQVCSDSGTEVDPAPVSPAKLLEDTLPSWESQSAMNARQKNLDRESSAQAASEKTGSNCWDSAVKAAKSGEAITGETASLARSTPNLTDNTGCTTSPHTWSSTGYISMPSSEEVSSSNPSPVSRENTNIAAGNTGGSQYCVVGSKPDNSKSNDTISDSNDEASDALIPIKRETMSATPYVSIALLEQQKEKQKENKGQKEKQNDDQRSMVAFGELNKQVGSFVDTRNKIKLSKLPSHISDKTKEEEPYVQTGLANVCKKPTSNSVEQSTKSGTFASTSVTGSCNNPYVSFVTTSCQSPDGASTKPSVSTSQTAAELPQSSKTADSKEPPSPQDVPRDSSHIAAPSEGTSSSYVFVSPKQSSQQMQEYPHRQEYRPQPTTEDLLRQENVLLESEMEDDDQNEVSLSLRPLARLNSHPRMPMIARQKSGYVTIVESPDSAPGRSDESYSKMTVAPRSTVQ